MKREWLFHKRFLENSPSPPTYLIQGGVSIEEVISNNLIISDSLLFRKPYPELHLGEDWRRGKKGQIFILYNGCHLLKILKG
jgi:hypothetical protein